MNIEADDENLIYLSLGDALEIYATAARYLRRVLRGIIRPPGRRE